MTLSPPGLALVQDVPPMSGILPIPQEPSYYRCHSTIIYLLCCCDSTKIYCLVYPALFSTVSVFFISHQAATEILKTNGMHDGMFVLRPHSTTAGHYVLTLAHCNADFHYEIRTMVSMPYELFNPLVRIAILTVQCVLFWHLEF